MTAGVYCLVVGDTYYVGQSATVELRIKGHLCSLKKFKHPSPDVRQAYMRTDEECTWYILEITKDPHRRVVSERYWQNRLTKEGFKVAGEIRPFKFKSEPIRAKIAAEYVL